MLCPRFTGPALTGPALTGPALTGPAYIGTLDNLLVAANLIRS
jgi:hypothetical protein